MRIAEHVLNLQGTGSSDGFAAISVRERSAHPGAAQPHRGSIDSLRGLVCLGVTFMHLYTITRWPWSGGYIGRCMEFALVYCRLGVESFFVLAGYFLAHTFRPTKAQYLSVPQYVRRRFLRLAVPYWVVVASLFLTAWAANVLLGRSNPLPSTGQVTAAMLFAQDALVDKSFPFFTLWSMAPLFQSYLARILGWASPVSDGSDRFVSFLVFMVSLSGSVAAGLLFYRLVERPSARLAGLVEYRR